MCEKIRCAWAGDLPIYIDYHDNEWGRPVHDDNKLFEMLILEGMQAGLSWITVLKKREAFRKAFDGFDPRALSWPVYLPSSRDDSQSAYNPHMPR